MLDKIENKLSQEKSNTNFLKNIKNWNILSVIKGIIYKNIWALKISLFVTLETPK